MRQWSIIAVSWHSVATSMRSHSFSVLPIIILGIVFLSYGSPTLATPTITWSERPLTITVRAGTATSVSVELEASRDLAGVTLSVVPELASFVSVYPTTFPTLVAGEPQTVSLGISVPAGMLLDTYEGTLHVKQGKRTLASPLSLSVDVVEAEFELVDLGPSLAHAINDSGQIVGANETNALYWENPYSAPISLTTPPGLPPRAEAINELGQMVGGQWPQAVFWNSHNTAAVYLNAYTATDINDFGQIVGYDPYVPLYWESSTSPPITLNGNFAVAKINNAGQMIGTSITSGGNVYAVFWEDSTSPAINLGTPVGSVHSQGYGINNAGQLAGEAVLADGTWLPVFWPSSASQPTVLATLGGTYNHCWRINDAGKIVGVAQTVDGINHAVVWDASTGSILDLNSVIPSDTNWVLNEARDYNAAGVIVGDGTLNGAARAFALVPSD